MGLSHFRLDNADNLLCSTNAFFATPLEEKSKISVIHMAVAKGIEVVQTAHSRNADLLMNDVREYSLNCVNSKKYMVNSY